MLANGVFHLLCRASAEPSVRLRTEKKKPNAYASGRLSKEECNCTEIDREALVSLFFTTTKYLQYISVKFVRQRNVRKIGSKLLTNCCQDFRIL